MIDFGKSKISSLQAATQLRRPNKFRIVLLTGSLLPLAFDVKKFGSDEGSAAQLLLVLLTLFFAITYVLSEQLSRNISPSPSRLRGVTALWLAYIGFSPFPVLLWGVDIEHYLKVMIPFALFGVGVTMMMAAERRRIDPAVVADILLCGCLISTVWRVFYAVVISGLSIETIRWQVLGPGVPFLLGYGAAGLYMRRRRGLSAFSLVIAITTIMLSITRSYLISIALVLGGIVFVDAMRRSWAHAVGVGTRRLALFAAVVLIGVGATIALRPDFFEDWLSRLFQHQAAGGADITLITRMAEYRGQIDALTRNTWSLLFGNGMGASYFWNPDLLESLPFKTDGDVRWFAGHSTWVYPFFASGIVFGAAVPLILIRGLIWSYKSARASVFVEDLQAAVVVLAAYLAYFGQSFTSNIFHERYAGLILGVLVGCAGIYVNRLQVARSLNSKPRKVSRGHRHSMA